MSDSKPNPRAGSEAAYARRGGRREGALGAPGRSAGAEAESRPQNGPVEWGTDSTIVLGED